MKPEDYVPIIVSILALLLAAASWWQSRRSAKAAERSAAAAEGLTTVELERRSEEKAASQRAFEAAALAEREANLKIDPPDANYLRVTNVGRVPAQDVVLEFESLDGQSLPIFQDSTCDALLPGREHAVTIFQFAESASRVRVTLTWTDDSGPHKITRDESLPSP